MPTEIQVVGSETPAISLPSNAAASPQPPLRVWSQNPNWRDRPHGYYPYFVLDWEGVRPFTSDSNLLSSITVDLPADHAIPTLTVVFRNIDRSLLADPAFREWRTVRVSLGYRDNIRPRGGTFITTGPKLTFSSDAVPTMTMRCYGLAFLMNLVQRRRSWFNVTYSDIARQIASEYGMRADVDDTLISYPEHTQTNETDWQFLSRHANKVGYQLFVDERDVLHFHKVRYEKSELVFFMMEPGSANLRDLTIRNNVFMRGLRVVATQFDPMTGRAFSAQSYEGDEDAVTLQTRGPGSSTASDLSIPRVSNRPVQEQPVEYLVEAGHDQSLPELRQEALGVSQASRWFLTGTASTFGVSALEPRITVMVGAMAHYTGEYYVTRVTHTISASPGQPTSGFISSFDLARTWRGPITGAVLSDQPVATPAIEGVYQVV